MLVKIILRERLSVAQTRKPKERKRWDVEKLKEEAVRKQFKEEINQILQHNSSQ